MNHEFTFSKFVSLFSTDDICLEEIKRLRFPKGITCISCRKITKHYRVKNRTAYVCKVCRHHTYPLKNTIFEKTSTPLRIWFYCMFLMTYTKAKISIRNLQKELGVTYKTAWRMYRILYLLMEQNNRDLLADTNRILRWTFFNKLELTVTEKKEAAA